MASPIRRTPVMACPRLGGHTLLKLENLQRTGSFKLRGAWTVLERMSPELSSRGVIAASAGNHGAGLALAAAEHGITARIVVPEGTPQVKRRRMMALGAEVIVSGAGYDAAERRARELAGASGAPLISAYDDDDIIEGNGASLARELEAQVESLGVELGRVVVPVGGGGLVAGLASVLSPRGVSVIGAQPDQNCAMYQSRMAGRALTEYEGGPTVAEGCEGAVADRTFELVEHHRVGLKLVSEEAIERAVAAAYREDGQIVECSAAVALAAAATLPATDGTTVVVVSGGNIDDADLDDILTRYPG